MSITTARVAITVEVDIDSTWGPDCMVKQIYHQAKVEATRLVQKGMRDSQMRLIGNPVVKMIIVED